MLRVRLPPHQVIARELLEVAARRRTYVLRCLAALGVLAVFGFNAHELERRWRGIGAIGHGMELVLPVLLCAGLVLLLALPAMAAVSVTREREQGTLVLLSLTPLGAWSQVLQKYLTQLVLAGSLALLTLPMLAIGYTLGGLDDAKLGQIAVLVPMLAIQLPAIGLAAGCVVRGTIGAIAIAYALALLQTLPFFVLPVNATPDVPAWLLSSPLMVVVSQPGMPGVDLYNTAIPLGFSMFLLLVARLSIVRRLEPAGESLLGRHFRRLDALFAALERRWLRRQVALDVPIADPVLWRESNRSSFCSWRYLIRLLLPLSAVLVALVVAFQANSSFHAANLVLVMAFYAGALAIALLGVGMVNRERSDQTLAVLLATGLSPRAILSQKARALSRLRWMALAILVLLIGGILLEGPAEFRPAWDSGWHAEEWDPPLLQLPMLALDIAITYGLCFWLAVRIALQARSHVRGVMLSIVAVALVCLAYPLLLALSWALPEWRQGFDTAVGAGIYLGPESADHIWSFLLGLFCSTHLSATLLNMEPRPACGAAMVLGWSVGIAAWLALRWVCLRQAPRWLPTSAP